jgi:uncharacterized membrane protein YdcZ (DUF606 family)
LKPLADGRVLMNRMSHASIPLALGFGWHVMKGSFMNAIKLVGVALIVLGALGLVYGGFSYTKDTTALKVGPVEMTVQEKKTVNVPLWAGIGAIVVGGVLLVMGGKKG